MLIRSTGPGRSHPIFQSACTGRGPRVRRSSCGPCAVRRALLRGLGADGLHRRLQMHTAPPVLAARRRGVRGRLPRPSGCARRQSAVRPAHHLRNGGLVDLQVALPCANFALSKSRCAIGSSVAWADHGPAAPVPAPFRWQRPGAHGESLLHIVIPTASPAVASFRPPRHTHVPFQRKRLSAPSLAHCATLRCGPAASSPRWQHTPHKRSPWAEHKRVRSTSRKAAAPP